MARKTPNIILDTTLKQRDRLGFKNFVLKVNTDTFIFSFSPDEIEVNDDIYFKLYLRNKRLVSDELVVDDITDYIDIYLYGVKQPQNRYSVAQIGNDIVVEFTADITRLPKEVSASDFEIKGKIAEVV
jgi:hypothetical protein